MQTKNYQSETRVPKNRSFGATPLPGKVRKIRGSHSGAPVHFENRLTFIDHELERGKLGTPHQVRWRSLVIWAIIVLVASSLWILANQNQEAGMKSQHPSLAETQKNSQPKFAAPSMGEALALTKRALENRIVASIPTLWHMGSSNAEDIARFILASDARDGSLDQSVWLGSMDANGFQVEGVQISFKNQQKRVIRLALLTPDEMGVWKVDFDAFAKTARPSWNEICAGGFKQAVVRVIISRDSYFNHFYRDETNWISYTLISDDIDFALHGYCGVGSPVAAALADALSDNAKAARVTLEISHDSNADLRQFEITRVLARDWIVNKTPNPQN